MTNAADELEQDVEASRGRLDRTLGDLQSRLQGPGIPRDLGDLKRSGQAAGEAVERFVADVRVNPVPALLIAGGLGLLVYDVFRSTARRRSTALSAGSPAADRDLAANRADRMEERLDEALEESFPGSDPVSVRITK